MVLSQEKAHSQECAMNDRTAKSLSWGFWNVKLFNHPFFQELRLTTPGRFTSKGG
jgi:hypothetical protein